MSKRGKRRRRNRPRGRRPQDVVVSTHTEASGMELDAQRTQGGRCLACDCQLGLVGGFGGTRMCGPCATGEAKTLEEFGETW